jgi:hypothetical protein
MAKRKAKPPQGKNGNRPNTAESGRARISVLSDEIDIPTPDTRPLKYKLYTNTGRRGGDCTTQNQQGFCLNVFY